MPRVGFPEDEPFLFEGAEQAVQGGEQVTGGDGRLPVERGLDVVAGDLAQAGDLFGPGGQRRAQAVEVGADGGERELRMRVASLTAENPYPAT